MFRVSQDGKKSSPVREPHIALPSLLREPSTLQTLTTTLSPILDGITSGLRAVSNGTGTAHFPIGLNASVKGSARSVEKIIKPSLDSPSEENRERSELSAAGSRPFRSALFSAWANATSCRRLLLVVEREGLRTWDVSDLEAIVELSWIRWDALLTSDEIEDLQPTSVDLWSDREEDTEIAVLFSRRFDNKVSSRVDIISLSSQSIKQSVYVRGIGTSFAFNKRALVIATREPCQLHLFSRETLQALPCSPINDLAGFRPIYTLGNSRWLAYATSKAPHDRDPPIAGRGFSEKSPNVFNSHDEGQPSGSPGSSSRSPGSWRDSISNSSDAVETAKWVGGGLMSGAKALGNWWTGSSEVTTPTSKTDPSDQTCSRSAPQSAYGLMAQTSPSHGLPPSSRRRSLIHTTGISQVANQGHVKVLDLGPALSAYPIVMAVTTVSANPISYLCFNPSSSWLFVANSEGHHFDIFEMRPQTRVGRSAVRGCSSNLRAPREARFWHRYRLSRGITTASVKSVAWSADSRLIAIATERGTQHIFALHPAGGLQDPWAVFGALVSNRQSFAPLSVNISSMAKVRPRFYSGPDSESYLLHPQRFDSPFSSAFAWIGLHSINHDEKKKRSSSCLLSEPQYKWPAAIHFDGLTCQLTVHHMEARRTSSVRATTAPALSGLSQLMQQRLSTSSTRTVAYSELPPHTSVTVLASALWELQASVTTLDADPINLRYPPPTAFPNQSRTERWTSFAEIDTFSRSLNILPKSIYTAQQFSFSMIDTSFEDDLMTGDLAVRRTAIKVRKEVEIAPGSGSHPAMPRGESSYGEPIRSAVETILDTAQPFSPESPPGFPNGLPAKHGNRWSTAMSITAAQVKPSLAGAQDFVRRVRQSRRISSSEIENVASVSFEDEDEDAIRIESQALDASPLESSLSDHENSEGWDDWSDDAKAGALHTNQAEASHRAVRGGVVPGTARTTKTSIENFPSMSPLLGSAPFELDEEWDDPIASSRPLPKSKSSAMAVMSPNSLGSHHKKRSEALRRSTAPTIPSNRLSASPSGAPCMAGMDLPQGLSSESVNVIEQDNNEMRFGVGSFSVGGYGDDVSILTQPAVSRNSDSGNLKKKSKPRRIR